MEEILLDMLITDYYTQLQELINYQQAVLQSSLENDLMHDLGFWNRVKVCLSDEEYFNLQNIEGNDNCVICIDTANKFKKLRCCKNKICIECSSNWFNESVYCPFCRHDLRK